MEPRHPEGASQGLGKGKVWGRGTQGPSGMIGFGRGSEDGFACTAQFLQMGAGPSPMRDTGKGSLENERS